MSTTFELIYNIVRRVPRGRVTTYGQVARLAGNPRLSRVVGYAMHSAPADVPCHRVVDRRGGLSDAFAPMGRVSHRLLLEMEGVEFDDCGNAEIARFMWRGDEN